MSKATASAEDPGHGELVCALERLAHERRLATLVEVAKVAGLTKVDTTAQRRDLIALFRSFEDALLEIDLDHESKLLRRALHDANPDFTPDRIDQLVHERLDGIR